MLGSYYCSFSTIATPPPSFNDLPCKSHLNIFLNKKIHATCRWWSQACNLSSSSSLFFFFQRRKRIRQGKEKEFFFLAFFYYLVDCFVVKDWALLVVCVWKTRRSICVNFGKICLKSWKVIYYLMHKHSCFDFFFGSIVQVILFHFENSLQENVALVVKYLKE